ncbi:hypothetical protein ET000_003664 [Escherichia coli]|nr:hypothetical protein [Escherichia coli]EFA3738940.1 hypothetical protein [Escherichia coli]
MTRYHCVLPRNWFTRIMCARIPVITLKGLKTMPQPGDELEISVSNPDRSTETIITDVLNARITPAGDALTLAVRPRHDPFAPEPLTPAGRIMQSWRDERAKVNCEKLINRIATTNRHAALARRIYPAKPTQTTGAKRP